MKFTNSGLMGINESNVEDIAGLYQKKYGAYIDAYNQFSIKRKINESLSPWEIAALGNQFDQFNNYKTFCESTNNLAALGVIPQIALDVITASVGTSIIPLLASVQPMREEHGIVYYKQIKSVNAAGGYTAGQVISDPLSRDNPGDGTFGTMRKTMVLTKTKASTTEYDANIPGVPVRPGFIELNVPGVGYGKDDYYGKILGFGFSGTIDYETGAVHLVFDKAPDADIDISVIYDIDVDSVKSLDKIRGSLLTKDIRAKVWALQADVGAFASFAFNQRFGRSAVDEVAADLTTELTRTMNTAAVKELYAHSKGNVTWDAKPSQYISYTEHKLSFIDAIAQAEKNINKNSGANAANRYICGAAAAAILRGMPNFQIADNAATVSVGLYGTYDGIPVIRATDVIPDNEMLLVSNAGNYFNAPLAYAPFMPLMVTNTVQSVNNPFSSTQAAGIWAGLTTLNDNLISKITIANTPIGTDVSA